MKDLRSSDPYQEFSRQLEMICARQGMYTGDHKIASLAIYMDGMFHGMDICGLFSYSDWRDWIYKRFPNNKGCGWGEVLVMNLGSESEAIKNLLAIEKRQASGEDCR